jgi:hypothetical protein
MVTKEEIGVLTQLISALDEAGEKLEESYFQKNIEGFESIKKFIINAEGKISEILK